jgi:hypothetical protein
MNTYCIKALKLKEHWEPASLDFYKTESFPDLTLEEVTFFAERLGYLKKGDLEKFNEISFWIENPDREPIETDGEKVTLSIAEIKKIKKRYESKFRSLKKEVEEKIMPISILISPPKYGVGGIVTYPVEDKATKQMFDFNKPRIGENKDGSYRVTENLMFVK